MADFCKQCSESLFGRDFGDLKGLGGPNAEPLKPDEGYPAICEGCGPTLVDAEGVCIAYDCIEQHNTKPEVTT